MPFRGGLWFQVVSESKPQMEDLENLWAKGKSDKNVKVHYGKVDLERPFYLDVDNIYKFNKFMYKELKVDMDAFNSSSAIQKKVFAYLESKGYDGLVYYRDGEPITLVAFNPSAVEWYDEKA